MSEPFNATQYARELLRKGRDERSIVHAIMARGRSHNGARMALCKAKARPVARATLAQGLGGGATHQFTLPAEMSDVLKREAAARNVSPHRLASDVMAALLDDNLVAAILDEASA